MSHFLDRLTYFSSPRETFAGDHGVVTGEDRTWEDAYRNRWAHDKIVRSTHGVNCTGSCSWKIYVKGGIVTWETQQTDYPRTRADLPNHEPRGCARGASYSWYLYSGNRVKYPLVRSRLLKLWREARVLMTPVAAWKSIVENPEKRNAYVSKRGLGGFVRSTWDEVNELIASANAYTAKTHGPDRIFGFSPIPAMSMVSYAAGSRYLSLLGGVCMSFYDWYCDLPPASPQTWGEQTDVPESASRCSRATSSSSFFGSISTFLPIFSALLCSSICASTWFVNDADMTNDGWPVAQPRFSSRPSASTSTEWPSGNCHSSYCGLMLTCLMPGTFFSPAMSISLSKWPMLPTMALSFIFAICPAEMMLKFPVAVMKRSAFVSTSSIVTTS